MHVCSLSCIFLAAPVSVCLYINFVALLHKEHGLPNPLVNNWLISCVIRGICWVCVTPVKPPFPITKDVTKDIMLVIWSCLNHLNSWGASFWAIVFGLFCKAHLLHVSGPRFDPAQQFTRSDHDMFSNTEYGYSVLVRWSKTIRLGQFTITVPLLQLSNSPLCPV